MSNSGSLVAIERLVLDYNLVTDKLNDEEPSVVQDIQRHLTKMLVLSCASYYEQTITEALKEYANQCSGQFADIPNGFSVIGNRSFHQMFDFSRKEPKLKEANKFLKPLDYFGSIFMKSLVAEISEDIERVTHMSAFQEICTLRNFLVHNDLINSPVIRDKTFNDIKLLHYKALFFVELLREKFKV